ncbi:hypothetical protein MHYP_G00169100 [Metynnis hypsauchen]
MTRAPLRPLQHLPAVLVVLLFFGGLLLVYFTPRPNWSLHTATPTDDVQSKNPRQSANTSYSASNTWKNGNAGRTQDVASTYVDSANRKDEPATVVLIWTWPFGHQFELRSCSSLYNITGCRLTSDRSQYAKAHGVMFHHREICHNLPSLLTIQRPPRQKWVWMNMESPANSPRLPGPDSLFNLTANYRRDSDVWVPYGWVVEASNDDKAFKIPSKDKLVCWIVNNWDDSFWRVKYFNQLSNHVKVDTFGGHFGSYLSYRDYFKTMSSCKFYLSFENSVHKDYITEKLFNPMISGSVPVVLGPPRANYEEFIPGDSFIHVNDFKTPQELAEHLKYLDQNEEMYEQYFTWRKHFVAKRSNFGLEHACRICDHIKQHKDYRVFKNLNTWSSEQLQGLKSLFPSIPDVDAGVSPPPDKNPGPVSHHTGSEMLLKTPTRLVYTASYLLLAVVALLFIGYRLSLERPLYPTQTNDNVCTDACIKALMKEKDNRMFKDCPAEDKKDERKSVAKQANLETEAEILILVWIWPFGAAFPVDTCESLYGIKNCRITDDRNQYEQADAVLFHTRDISDQIPNLLKLPRFPLQMWVWMDSEPPSYTPQLSGADDLFNLTSNYRRDSDIWAPYGRVMKATEEEKAFQIPKKDKLVCWIVSHWNEEFKRVDYFKEFSKHIQVEGFGKHFRREVNTEDFFKVIASCKFYLSFENSIHKDYISEKVFHPLVLGTVPVVIGPPRDNYEEFIPRDAFIHIDDFTTPKDLAEHLKAADQNQEIFHDIPEDIARTPESPWTVLPSGKPKRKCKQRLQSRHANAAKETTN